MKQKSQFQLADFQDAPNDQDTKKDSRIRVYKKVEHQEPIHSARELKGGDYFFKKKNAAHGLDKDYINHKDAKQNFFHSQLSFGDDKADYARRSYGAFGS